MKTKDLIRSDYVNFIAIFVIPASISSELGKSMTNLAPMKYGKQIRGKGIRFFYIIHIGKITSVKLCLFSGINLGVKGILY